MTLRAAGRGFAAWIPSAARPAGWLRSGSILSVAVAIGSLVGLATAAPAELALESVAVAGHVSSAARVLAAAAPLDNVDRWGVELSSSEAEFDYAALPGRLSVDRLRALWREGLDLERRGALLESAERYESIVSEVPEESYTYWRIARNYWRHGESLPVDAKDQRIAQFERSESWAGRGISIDSECAACMLWKFVAMGRQATTRGLMSAVRDVGEMDDLLTRGIELQPDHIDNAGNATLGNLYYSGAVFYRVIPDWWWLELFFGVRGDKQRSLSYARRAVQISEMRVDYRVELGAVLLCLGIVEDRPEAIRQGIGVLREARKLDDFLSTDPLDKAHAVLLMDAPSRACGYSRDGFIDLDSLEAEARAQR